MVGREHRDFGNRLERLRTDHRCKLLSLGVGLPDEFHLPDLRFEVGRHEIGRVRQVGIAPPVGLAPAIESAGQRNPRRFDPRLAVDARKAAGQHRLGFVIERAQQLAFPAVPHARSHGANVAHGQDQQIAHPLQRLRGLGKGVDGAPVRKGRETGPPCSSSGAGARARTRIRSAPRSCRAAGTIGARCAHRQWNDPPGAPWRCRG